ncbi:WD40-repeat-containing domain protein [Gaertneriomyces semiglobifer]|nr:WD40-repeat-containing domain protein [Gaertneriomyces semiglobifer]
MDEKEKERTQTLRLKHRIETLEKENILLKKSLYDLSVRYGGVVKKREKVFLIDDLGVDGDSASGGVSGGEVVEGVQGEGEGVQVDRREERRWWVKYELKGHLGAIYTLRFSPSSHLLATGSFDKTIKIWDTSTHKEVYTLKKHGLNVSDVSWSRDERELLSGAYDQTCKVWDVEVGKMVGSWQTEGFVQCVAFDGGDRNVFYSGTSRNILSLHDRRTSTPAHTIHNDSMINTLHVCSSPSPSHPSLILTGDSSGYLKTWDIRSPTQPLLTPFLVSPTKKPISHISIYPTTPLETPTTAPTTAPTTTTSTTTTTTITAPDRFCAVNSYDNLLRVFDRGTHPLPTHNTDYRLLCALKGSKNKNWPIKSAWQPHTSTTSHHHHHHHHGANDYANDYTPLTTNPRSLSNMTEGGGGALVQRLEGHGDRVYAVDWGVGVLASCSADFTVKVWGVGKNR